MGLKSPRAAMLRRGSDEELWQKLDKKLAEREAKRGKGRFRASEGWLSRLARGMGFRKD